MFISSNRWEGFIHNLPLLFFIFFVTSNLAFSDDQVELSLLDWIIENDDTEATLEVTFQDEILIIPLQKAPFCRLTITHKCDCFVLRRDQNISDWDVGSFVYCDGRVHGEFMNSTDYFEIAPSKDRKSKEHSVTKLGPPKKSIEREVGRDFEYKIPDREDYYRYFEPLPEYFPLNRNETAYLKCFFVVDREILDILPEDSIDIFLQNLINTGNHFYHEFNILIIYYGWALALPGFTSNAEEIDIFLREGYRSYDKKIEYNTITLLTPTLYDNGRTRAVGKATVGSMCWTERYAIYVMYREDRDALTKRNQLRTFIHEIGHQFGFLHTENMGCQGEEPPNTVWIMRNHTVWKPGILIWSRCSIKYMHENRHKRSCLRLKDSPYQPFCGDGLVQKGEECDCISETCRKCCDEKCFLKEGSKCSNGPCCDTSTCTHIKGIQCRAAQDSCDIPEICDGISGQCPPNYVVANGYRCGPGNRSGYCFNGRCGRHQDVCSWIYIDGRVPGDECYKENLEGGSDLGGCGPVLPETGSKNWKCQEKDKFCGKIWCKSERRRFAEKFEYLYNTRIIGVENQKGCYTLVTGDGRVRMDPTFVQNGSDCGNGRMCVQQKCIPLPQGCPKNCPGENIVHPFTKETFPAFILRDSKDSTLKES